MYRTITYFGLLAVMLWFDDYNNLIMSKQAMDLITPCEGMKTNPK